MVYIHQRQESEIRRELLLSKLDAHAEVINNAYEKGTVDLLLPDIPKDLRVTIVNNDGKVLLDTGVPDASTMGNHDTRPELQQARFHKVGTSVRTSKTTGTKTFYYARYYGDHYIRAALPYDHVNTYYQGLETNNYYFIYTSIIVFLLMMIALFMLVRRYNTSLRQLGDLSNQIAQGVPLDQLALPSDDFGAMGQQIVDLLKEKEQAIAAIREARKRLILHFKLSNIGIALFDKDGNTEFANSHFILYANMLATRPMTNANELIDEPNLEKVKHFLEDKKHKKKSLIQTINQCNKIFEIKALKSKDGSFELTIEDITKEENNRVLKHEMTSSITQKLRTPLISIRSYLETLNFMDISDEKRKEFTQKAYSQAVHMNEVLDDIRLLTKLDDEDEALVDFTPVNLRLVAEEIRIAYTAAFTEHGITFANELPSELTIRGNQSLLYDIFKNLVENSLRYAGDNIEINIRSYHEDKKYAYISYHDTGKGVDEKTLGRLFDRFYRADEGKSEEGKGGTGLGLSIVRNAIQIHGGQVQARIHPSGGLEVLFHLRK